MGGFGRLALALVSGAVLASGCGERAPDPNTDLDGFLQSEEAHREMMHAACGDTPQCLELPHFFRTIKEADPETYNTFISRAKTTFADQSKAAEAGFQFAMEVMNTANKHLDDDSLQTVLTDTAASIREMKAVYPQMCVALLTGQGVTPPQDIARQMFKPERYRLNVTMMKTAAANRQRVAKGELTLPSATAEEVTKFSENFFLGLPPETMTKVEAVMSGAGPSSDNVVACDVMEGLMTAISARPKEEAGAIMRGLSNLPM